MTKRSLRLLSLIALATALLLGGVARATTAAGIPGSAPLHTAAAAIHTNTAPANPLTPFYSASGHISDSVDGMGTLNTQGTIRVQKPDAGATVRAAFLMSASTGYSQYQLTNTDVKIGLGQTLSAVAFSHVIQNDIQSTNGLADVTSILKPIVDAAAPGIITLTVQENNTDLVDGEALAVVFDDPLAPSTNSVVLLFGAQNPAGDKFSINFAHPVNTSSPTFKLNMGIGDSFSYQTGGVQQYSVIDVNGPIPGNLAAADSHRLTTSAGGQDDLQGINGNGALMTVGGIGDGPFNPPNPLAKPTDARSDHEYWDLRHFVPNGANTLTVNTLNPSNDDNIFFAYFEGNPPVTVTTGGSSQAFTFNANARCSIGGAGDPAIICGNPPPGCQADGNGDCLLEISLRGSCTGAACIWTGGGSIGGDPFNFTINNGVYPQNHGLPSGIDKITSCGPGCTANIAQLQGAGRITDLSGRQHGGGTFKVDVQLVDSDLNTSTGSYQDTISVTFHNTPVIGDQTYSWNCTGQQGIGPNCTEVVPH